MVYNKKMKKQYIKDVKVNEIVSCYFLVRKAEKKTAKTGKSYWQLSLQDASASINAKIWSPLSESVSGIEEKAFIYIEGKIGSYNGVLDIAIQSVRVLDDVEKAQLDYSEFLPASVYSIDSMWTELMDICKEVFTYKPWYSFVTTCLSSEEVYPIFTTAAAAKTMHHSYRSGLLEHVLSVSKLCILLAEYYPQLDKQVLLAGAIFHDMGKILEMKTDIVTEYTTPGLLLGHLYQGIELIVPYMNAAGLDEELQMQLKHMILSHHGCIEFGSPKDPQTAEALVLHYADNIDAKLEMFRKLFEDTQEDEAVWSARQWGFNNNSLFKPLSTPYFEKNIIKNSGNMDIYEKESLGSSVVEEKSVRAVENKVKEKQQLSMFK
ncbi:MAG: 3'-5' exoribonuclease YhaM family protein [Desulfovibrionaceae bacterium]